MPPSGFSRIHIFRFKHPGKIRSSAPTAQYTQGIYTSRTSYLRNTHQKYSSKQQTVSKTQSFSQHSMAYIFSTPHSYTLIPPHNPQIHTRYTLYNTIVSFNRDHNIINNHSATSDSGDYLYMAILHQNDITPVS